MLAFPREINIQITHMGIFKHVLFICWHVIQKMLKIFTLGDNRSTLFSKMSILCMLKTFKTLTSSCVCCLPKKFFSPSDQAKGMLQVPSVKELSWQAQGGLPSLPWHPPYGTFSIPPHPKWGQFHLIFLNSLQTRLYYQGWGQQGTCEILAPLLIWSAGWVFSPKAAEKEGRQYN